MEQILEAELLPATEHVAMLLAIHASRNNGQVNLRWDEFLNLCRVNDIGAARRHLTRLSQAGLIHYSTNEFVYITWLAWMHAPYTARPRAVDSASNVCETGDESQEELPRAVDGVPTRRQQRAHAPSTAREGTQTSHARVGRSVGSDLHSPIEEIKITDQPTKTRARASPLTEEGQRNYDLLREPEVNLSHRDALAVCGILRFDVLIAFVMNWLDDAKAGDLKKPHFILTHRIRHHKQFNFFVTNSHRQTELYRKYYPEDALPPKANTWHEIADEYNSYSLEPSP